MSRFPCFYHGTTSGATRGNFRSFIIGKSINCLPEVAEDARNGKFEGGRNK